MKSALILGRRDEKWSSWTIETTTTSVLLIIAKMTDAHLLELTYNACVSETEYFLMCPICWDRDLNVVDGVRVSLTDATDQRTVRNATVYHCKQFRYFALFHENVG
ncbi:MAG: hypothetical protein WBS19_10500 [Candidatus Korobacteraceae bacterium]